MKIINCILFIISFNFNSYCQKKISLYNEAGCGIQFSKTKIPGSKYVSVINNPNPKIFLGLGFNYKVNEELSFDLNLNLNPSKVEIELKYHNDSDHIYYKFNYFHKDINLGLATGMRYYWKNSKKITLGGGFKFQKIIVHTIFQGDHFEGGLNDTTTYKVATYYSSNDFVKNYNLFGYYLNAGYTLDKKKMFDLILELNGSINKPMYGMTEFYYNNQFIEKVVYKTNIQFIVLKIRRKLR